MPPPELPPGTTDDDMELARSLLRLPLPNITRTIQASSSRRRQQEAQALLDEIRSSRNNNNDNDNNRNNDTNNADAAPRRGSAESLEGRIPGALNV